MTTSRSNRQSGCFKNNKTVTTKKLHCYLNSWTQQWIIIYKYVRNIMNVKLTIFIVCAGTLKHTLPRASVIFTVSLIFSLHSSSATGSNPVATVASIVTNAGSALLSSNSDKRVMFITTYHLNITSYCAQVSHAYNRFFSAVAMQLWLSILAHKQNLPITDHLPILWCGN
jgi:hypothetical protein